jgi:hypothetical protein
VGLREAGEFIGLEAEFLDFDTGLKNVRYFGIEEEAERVPLEVELDVVVVGAVDDEVKVDFKYLGSPIGALERDSEELGVELVVGGCEVHPLCLLPLRILRGLP